MDRRVAVVVEDDDDIRELMAALLGQSGFIVHQAETGAAGVDAVRAHAPVVVTVDLGLPDFDGYEVTRRVRQFSDAYVVMLTARTEEIDTLLGLEAGADDYVTKPFRPRELRARIEAMLRRPRTASTASASPAVSPALPPAVGPAPPATASPVPPGAAHPPPGAPGLPPTAPGLPPTAPGSPPTADLASPSAPSPAPPGASAVFPGDRAASARAD